jgi:hypothetical protein
MRAKVYVGTAALGCPVEQSSTGVLRVVNVHRGDKSPRAFGTAEGGCPHISLFQLSHMNLVHNGMVAPEGLEPPTLSSED